MSIMEFHEAEANMNDHISEYQDYGDAGGPGSMNPGPYEGYDSKFVYYGGSGKRGKRGFGIKGAKKSTYGQDGPETEAEYEQRREREDNANGLYWMKEGRGFKLRELTGAEKVAKSRKEAASAGRKSRVGDGAVSLPSHK